MTKSCGNLKTQRCKIYQKQLKPNGLDSRLRGNDGIWVSILVFCFRGNDGIKEVEITKQKT